MVLQVMVIGLGTLGMSLARNLTKKGAEVLAVDINKDLVDEAVSFASAAVCLDASDEEELLKLNPKERDVAVCAIGANSRESSILCTALLRQMGAPMIASRAKDETHARILKLVGAHRVFNPEEEYGRRFANNILYRNLIAEGAPEKELQLTEICLPPSMEGKNLIQLALPARYGIIVAAVRRGDSLNLRHPVPADPLRKDDRLLVVCDTESLEHLLQDNSK